MAGACDRSSLLAGCVAEAVRVRAPGVAVRMATCDLAMPSASGQSVHISKVKQVYLRSLTLQVWPLQLGCCRCTFCLFLRNGESNSVALKTGEMLFLSLGQAVLLHNSRTLKHCDLEFCGSFLCRKNHLQHMTHHHLICTSNLDSRTFFGL